ncbi:homologous-pairing protein 2 homolog isoform X2 [Halichondria panicea]|uniref:homologous-pairing protein 2 homolog isoform X2 n=1 Tax=Halichondria panicea TaxID=6063 RepID=UPI00312B3BE4
MRQSLRRWIAGLLSCTRPSRKHLQSATRRKILCHIVVEERKLAFQYSTRGCKLNACMLRSYAHCLIHCPVLSSLTSSLTSEDASKQLKALTAQISEMKSRLATIKAGTDSVTPEESLKIHKNHEQCFKQWRKRKRMANDMLEAILEGYPKSKKQLCEEVGIETDEESGVKLPGK